MALPSNLSFGTVTGRFVRAVIDSADPDRDPDGVPISGLSIRFTAPAGIFKDRTATPPVTILVDPILASTNEDGILVGPDGQEGIKLLATDDPDLEPTGWTWNVSIAASNASVNFKTISFNITLPSGSTQDLTTAIPVPSNPGGAIADWLAVTNQVETARDEAVAASVEAEAARDGMPINPQIIDGYLWFDTVAGGSINSGKVAAPSDSSGISAAISAARPVDYVTVYTVDPASPPRTPDGKVDYAGFVLPKTR